MDVNTVIERKTDGRKYLGIVPVFFVLKELILIYKLLPKFFLRFRV